MRWNIINSIGLIFLFAAIVGKSNEVLLDSAYAAYSNGNYLDAEEHYEDLIESGFFGEQLYYNQGNVKFKLGKLGESILMYEKALWINPSFDDAQHNLKIAKAQTIDEFEKIPDFSSEVLLIKLHKFLPANFIAVLSLILLLSALVYIIYKRIKDQKLSPYIASILLVFTFLMYGLSSLQVRAVENYKQAIVLKNQVNIFSEPTKEGKLILTLNEGTKIQVLSVLDDYNVEIKTPDGNVGWVNRKKIGFIQ